jgi:DNA-binding XRE family transcriptional regulator
MVSIHAGLQRRRRSFVSWRAVFAHTAGVNRTVLSKPEKGASYPVLEIIAMPATVLEVECRETSAPL